MYFVAAHNRWSLFLIFALEETNIIKELL